MRARPSLGFERFTGRFLVVARVAFGTRIDTATTVRIYTPCMRSANGFPAPTRFSGPARLLRRPRQSNRTRWHDSGRRGVPARAGVSGRASDRRERVHHDERGRSLDRDCGLTASGGRVCGTARTQAVADGVCPSTDASGSEAARRAPCAADGGLAFVYHREAPYGSADGGLAFVYHREAPYGSLIYSLFWRFVWNYVFNLLIPVLLYKSSVMKGANSIN